MLQPVISIRAKVHAELLSMFVFEQDSHNLMFENKEKNKANI